MSINIKKRNWACVLYPDSLPDNWEQILIDSGISCCYAFHDKDINPTGEVKKPHYHVILSYSGPTTYRVVDNFVHKLGSQCPQALEQVRGYYRYLTHKDNPEKYQYSDDIIHTINGFDTSDFSELTQSQVDAILDDLINIIQQNSIYEYSDLVDLFHGDEKFSNYTKVIRKSTIYLREYINSRRYKKEQLAKIEKSRRSNNNAIN